MKNAYDELEQRGFLYQVTDEPRVKKYLETPGARFYVGFDPTASSLHAGSLVPVMAMRLLQKWGHHPIALVGGGTGMVGDPSGKTESRKVLLEEEIKSNAEAMEKQLSRFMVLDGKNGQMADNVDWLLGLGYISFLRDIGKHFSVNKMLSAESYKIRLETGLSFLEFNCLLLQAYAFLVLFERESCALQLGGQDQWGNIVAGIDLVRRKLQGDAMGLTMPLLMNSSGEKFGKSVSGAVWLDAERTSPFDYYQFWRNTEDADVGRFLKLFTELPPEECERLGNIEPPLLNRAKEILAFEATSIAHSPEEAARVFQASAGEFGEADPDRRVETSSAIAEIKVEAAPASLLPQFDIDVSKYPDGLSLIDLYVQSGLLASKGEARRLIRQGGARVDDVQHKDEKMILNLQELDDSFILKAGKKRVLQINLLR